MSWTDDANFSWPPRVQVAGVSSLAEAMFCRAAGVDALGFTLGLPEGIHDGLTPEKTRRIIERLPQDVLPVLITYLDDAIEARRLTVRIGAAAIQFHGGIKDEQAGIFRAMCPGIRTIGRVTVSGPQALDEAARFRLPLWDAIILDSLDPSTGRKGATGHVHDWSLSRQIVEASPIPVILAGGLNPENVTRAIREVRPHGVDAHTGLEEADGARSLDKIQAFALAARAAFGLPAHPGSPCPLT